MFQENNSPANVTQNSESVQNPQEKTKFCKYCGGKIPEDAVLCHLCGRQVEELKQNASAAPSIVINNSNSNVNTNTNNVAGGLRGKNKWVALLLCLFLGVFGVHKFYEGKILLGIVYICTLGFCGIGVICDFISLLFKPNPYYA